MALRLLLMAALAAVGADGVRSQELSGTGPVQAPVLTLDQDRLFRDSIQGQTALERFEADRQALARENRQIEAELAAEEQRLTTLRGTVAPDSFRAMAEQFDQKVVSIRQAQDRKERQLSQRRDRLRQEVLERAAPLVLAIARERGAFVVLDKREVFLSASAIDITDMALERLGRLDGEIPPPRPD
ncbi:MAG: OmpH family outer membrane protein [Pseudomonadota bacterium]